MAEGKVNPILETAVKAVESAVNTVAEGKLVFYNTAKLALPDGSTLKIQIKKASEKE